MEGDGLFEKRDISTFLFHSFVVETHTIIIVRMACRQNMSNMSSYARSTLKFPLRVRASLSLHYPFAATTRVVVLG